MTKARDLAGFSTGSITNTTADGLILKGDGSSTDVVIKNGANATVATVSDGSTNLSVAGSVTGALARGAIQVGNSSGVAAALAKGTSGYVLTAGANDLSWAEGGGGAMEFIASSGAINNAANVSFTQFDASKYDHYQFWMQSVAAATDNVTLVCQVSTNGGSNYDSTNGNYHTNQGTDAIGLMVSVNMGNQSQESISGQFSLFNPHTSDKYTTASASNMAHLWNGGGGAVGGASLDFSSRHYLGSAHLTAQDVDAVRFIMSSGNIASGEIVMYGIKNA